MKSKDDFLILGFTGAFCSGCTTAAMFFRDNLYEAAERFVGNKAQINADIANFYNETKVSENGNIEDKDKRELKRIELKKQILRLVRRRQLMNALDELMHHPFFYISMTNTMLGLTIEDIVLRKTTASDVPQRYKRFCGFALEWIKRRNFLNSDVVSQIRQALENRDVKGNNVCLVRRYLDELQLFREELVEFYKGNNCYSLFDIMQNVGNNLRKYGGPFGDDLEISSAEHLSILAERAGRVLKFDRKLRKAESPTFYAIECFRNPSEIDYFRRRFYEFYLFSIFSDEEDRFKRAREKYRLGEDACSNIDTVDQGGEYAEAPHKQNIKRCVYLADIAVTNRRQQYNFFEELLKYYTMIRKPGRINPTHKERNMNLAYSVSLNSSCICRQVGAVIVKKGYVIGAGWNDTDGSRWGCLYRLRRDVADTNNESFPICSDKDYEGFKKLIVSDNRRRDESFCFKDEYAEFKNRQIGEKTEATQNKTEAKISQIGSLQYCRALHAEENAILQSSKIGGTGLEDATLYTTTFPCELCAKKILQVGIGRIVYCEPYPKSLSKEVFFNEGTSKTEIIPFEGVKSPSFFRLFKPPLDIKDQQKLDAMRDRE